MTVFNKQAILYLIALYCSLTGFSQNSISFSSGITRNVMQSSHSNPIFTKIQANYGYSFEAAYQYGLNNKLAIGAAVTALQKNYEIKRTGDFSGAYQSFTRNYLQASVYLRIRKESGKFYLMADFGGYSAWWFAGRLKGNIPDIFSATNTPGGENIPLRSYNEKYNFSSVHDRRLEFGGLVAISGAYRLTKRYLPFISLGYFHALNSDQKAYTINQAFKYSRTLYLNAGININLPQ